MVEKGCVIIVEEAWKVVFPGDDLSEYIILID